MALLARNNPNALPGGGRARCRFKLAPPQTIALSFAGMILVGALLLMLPIASASGKSTGFLNALFTATSANCVTGLVVVSTLAHWSVFGKAVILVLIQLGGLGLTAVLTVGMVLLRRRISLKSRLVVQAAFNQENTGGMVRLVWRIIKITLGFEVGGAVLLTLGFYFSSAVGFGRALSMGIFHSVSAFCNAGFDIVGEQSLIPYQTNLFINVVFIVLIVGGGLGFIVWAELLCRPQHKVPGRTLRMRLIHLSLHTKLVLCITAALLLLGTGLFLATEWNNPGTLGPLSVPQKVLAALFQSVTLRTCGFFSISQGALTETAKALSALLMLIGGSPAGTAGGIKTVTLGIVMVAMISALRGRKNVEAFGRTLPLMLLQKALTVVCSMCLMVFVSTLLLVFTEQNSAFHPTFLDLLFETTSAAGTVGLTTGLTPYLSAAGKVIITLTMFLGRISPVTLVVALNLRQSHSQGSIAFPEERVFIG